jgi:hypothetical protein
LPEEATVIVASIYSKEGESVPFELPYLKYVASGESIVVRLAFPDTLEQRVVLTVHPDWLEYTPDTVESLIPAQKFSPEVGKIPAEPPVSVFVVQASSAGSGKKKVRLYLAGFSEAAWENLKGPLYATDESVEVRFETVLISSDLTVCLLVEIDNFDPEMFNELRSEGIIVWWEYTTRPPTSEWGNVRRRIRDMKSD